MHNNALSQGKCLRGEGVVLGDLCCYCAQVELEQLQLRFPGEECELLEKSQERITYLIHYSPTNQDWVS